MSAEETPPDDARTSESKTVQAGEAVYAATSADSFIRFSPAEKAALFSALYEVIPEYRGRLRIFTPRSSLLSLVRRYSGTPKNGHYPAGAASTSFSWTRSKATFPLRLPGGRGPWPFSDLNPSSIRTKPFCTRCDWECFRDPSELLGPVMDLFTRPLSLARRFLADPAYRRAWVTDVRYALACDGCSAVIPPDRKKLARFATPAPAV
jgi:hypothetical protein